MNLRKSRVLFAVMAAAFLILCNIAYLVSQAQGKQVEFASQMDKPPIQILSLLVLVGIIIFASLKTDEEDVPT